MTKRICDHCETEDAIEPVDNMMEMISPNASLKIKVRVFRRQGETYRGMDLCRKCIGLILSDVASPLNR